MVAVMDYNMRYKPIRRINWYVHSLGKRVLTDNETGGLYRVKWQGKLYILSPPLLAYR